MEPFLADFTAGSFPVSFYFCRHCVSTGACIPIAHLRRPEFCVIIWVRAARKQMSSLCLQTVFENLRFYVWETGCVSHGGSCNST